MRTPIRSEDLTKAISTVVRMGCVAQLPSGEFVSEYPVSFHQGMQIHQNTNFVHADLEKCRTNRRINQVLDALSILGRLDAETHEQAIDVVVNGRFQPDATLADLIIAATCPVN